MSFTAEQKSQLAKLLATENLTVQHQKISTARFDPTNRILYLPIWQNMSGNMYDLLVGHEVGHALYTPAQGWHDAVVDTDKNKNYKNFLNVVEDARIEKKVKRKYPGLNSAFRIAYQELTNRDFFGIKGRDVNEMPFIDRLNLFSKSQWSTTWIRFSANEELLVKEVQSAETWDDVVRITEKIYQYSKEEQHEMALEYYEEMMAEMQMSDEYEEEYETSDYGGDYDDEGDDQQSRGQGDADEEEFEEGQTQSQRSQSSNEEIGDNDLESGNQILHEKDSHPGSKDQFNPNCQTDENYRRNEHILLDDKCKEFVYVDIPKPNMSNIITPVKRVQELMTADYKDYVQKGYIPASKGIGLLNEFKRRNERYVSLLAKEFEMRKAAKSFSKSKLSDTGDIDINKLSSYKFDDNIFRKVMMVPKGKNHGLVLLLDRSGSMSNNMSGSIEQILVLSMFCRKVNIPFIVYGFTESEEVRAIDLGFKINTEEGRQFIRNYTFDADKYRSFSSDLNELSLSNVHLREYLNSKMSNAEFTNALKNMCLLMEAYKEKHFSIPRPDSERLNNTPMTQAIVATAQIMDNFKKQNNLDICSLVIVHDGDSDYVRNFWSEKEVVDRNTNQPKMIKSPTYMDYGNRVFYLRDRKNKFEVKMSNDELSQHILRWFTKITGARVFGFFIIPSGRHNLKWALNERYTNSDGKNMWQIKAECGYEFAEEYKKKLVKQFKEEKFLATKLPGFESFFLISGGSELTTDDEDGIEVDGKITARKLATAFAKYNKKRAVNRVLVSRFIQGIAA